ncbi:MAG: 3'-5' exonuclease domain-containing protein 2 [Muribaculaceae bacterium]|nr:3'-5' exonuclease domain-containing protein 2 [Muribaculaceae bacterium]
MESNPTNIITITKEQLATMPVVTFPGKITVIDKIDEAVSALEYLSSQKTIGFDTETKPAFKKGQTNKVSLIQMSSADQCFLFRINKIGFIPQLKQLIEDESITKIGLSLKDDFLVLHRIWQFTPAGFIDLQNMAKRFNIADGSLQKIYGILFSQRISKGQRLSNWEAEALSESQQMYASIDAWACLKIYNYLLSGNFNPEESPYQIEKSELL